MSDDSDVRATPGEPSPEDFEAAEEEKSPAGPGAVFLRVLRVLGVLLLVFALLLYFVVPFRNVFIDVLRQWRIPTPKLQSIPLAPEHNSNPKLPT